MPELPQKKVGIVACSGEELPEGLASRLAALKVLEELRPGETVTICLPLFLAGGESDRAFARFYPTIAIDGCEKRCAYRGTERYSNRPAAGLVISALADPADGPIAGLRRLNEAGQAVVERAAQAAAARVDELLGRAWSRREGVFAAEPKPEPRVETCACGSGVAVQHVLIGGQDTVVVALPLILEQFAAQQRLPDESTAAALVEMAGVYNPIAPEAVPQYRAALLREYIAYLEKRL